MKDQLSRRAVLKSLALATGVGATLSAARSAPAAPVRLAVEDPAAIALGYVTDTAQIDRNKDPTYATGQSCANCLQLQGNAGEPYQPCALFPGKLVAVNGWCKGWTPEI